MMSFFRGEAGDTKKVLSLYPGRKATRSTLEKRKLLFSQMSPVFGGTLTLSFLLLTCTSSKITQALRKIYEWLSKQMLLNEKVHTACSSLSQYSHVDKNRINLYIHLLSNRVRKKGCFVQSMGDIQYLGKLADNAVFIPSAHSIFHSVHTNSA